MTQKVAQQCLLLLGFFARGLKPRCPRQRLEENGLFIEEIPSHCPRLATPWMNTYGPINTE